MLIPELYRNEINSMKISKTFILGLPRRLFYKRKEKVFVIGFHKTGTSSLGKALQILGYSVCGSLKEAYNYEKFNGNSLKYIFRKAKPLLNKYEAFQDTPWFLLYNDLYRLYPNAKFILTTREKVQWMKSVQNHFGNQNFSFHHLIYGTLDSINDEKIYLNRYIKHNEDVRYFFKKKKNFLELKLEEDFEWDKLCKFLNISKPKLNFPHVNKSQSRNSFTNKIKRNIKSFYYH